MNITPEFAELYGAFAGDGWIGRGSGGLSLFITGNPADEKDYYWKRIRPLFKETTGLVVMPRAFEYWGTFGVMVCRREIIEKFLSVSAPIGKKARIITVPDFALSDSGLFVAFSRGLFDTDGCISFHKSYNKNASVWQKTNRHRPRIFFSTVSYSLAKTQESFFP
jgi:intein/homing endonuclease